MGSSDTLLARFMALHPKLIDLSLGRILTLLERLGDPQKRLPPVIHVAGTNGKGSTIAFMRAILEAAGLSVHVYISPHLVRFHERIRLGAPGGGRFVDEDKLVEALERCEAVNAGDPITFFEMTTAAGLLLFAENPADVLLLEVGLGGRFDATNVIAHPACTVVTPVSLDHSEYLGNTVTKIAGEKAGIFKRGAPAVIAPQEPEPTAVLEAAAERAGASRILIGAQDFNVHEAGGRLVYEDGDGLLDLPLPRLTGRHQHINAGTAIAALRAAGYGGLPARAFEDGMRQADWPARLQRLARGHLAEIVPEGAELWLDGGHNPDGGRVLAQAMADLADRNPAPLVMVAGLLSTKDAAATLGHFKGLAQALYAVPIQNSLAARPAEEVAEAARSAGLVAEVSSSVEQALRTIAARDWPAPPRILICGSLYLAGEVLSANGTPPT
ncbi:bifunctional folylpolyglutamate synthase/dihydrofolate synthase [Bosea thiooxidans]|uniref:Dihydrofolate synthase/folylpolyglutamate synthase n=1 Tax=Bosea thiooxidans TaxID=53254 RepID=A0A0Q3T2Z3_9HYPH|nr:folylpolyglutamate synthase/dihydrofolate synthase family protein [Bosea thiooxidans]KQK32042.1 bifunctional folylpolyglutamate synthase/dihydrofolate synthase [Bosea thiooxidans]SKB85268.1 dihydrofolate synthase / folylpolyglutamate synthase [Bosea thiooxidans]